MNEDEELLAKAQEGRLEPSDIDTIIARLSSRSGDPYLLIHALGLGGTPSLASVVEPYLTSREDPLQARIALQVLCDFWGLAVRYRENVSSFIDGVPWDLEGDIRSMGISIAGEFIRDHNDVGLLRQLLDIVNNETEPMDTREWALRAVGRAIGLNHSDLPSLGVPLNGGLSEEILQKARECYARWKRYGMSS